MEQEQLAVTVAEQGEQLRAHAGRIAGLEHRQEETERLVSAMSALETEQAHIKEDVCEIKGDVKKLAAIPGERWTRLAEAVLAAIVGWLLARLPEIL